MRTEKGFYFKHRLVPVPQPGGFLYIHSLNLVINDLLSDCILKWGWGIPGDGNGLARPREDGVSGELWGRDCEPSWSRMFVRDTER